MVVHNASGNHAGVVGRDGLNLHNGEGPGSARSNVLAALALEEGAGVRQLRDRFLGSGAGALRKNLAD